MEKLRFVLARASGPFCFVLLLAIAASARSEEPVGLQVPEGFEVSLYADDDLAHDVFSMTTDARGRIVVSGTGYVRILVDSDGDGKADAATKFANGPKSGAQGMCFLGTDLFCTGDEGLIRYRDQDGDDHADGPPETFLRMKTGSEHNSHAIERGPDGSWYIVCGNETKIDATYNTLPNPLIAQPLVGTVLRLKPDLSAGEVIADGYRNSYDFAFNHRGDLFVFDSDDEREISLPWYRPTRVFHALPGSNVGWISRSWKHPDSYPDMPPVIGSFGRGSPTGVACYMHHAFPEPYRNALFIEDWTFGRVIALPLEPDGSTWKSEPIEFMTGVGQFGFAPTDVVVGPKGDLFVSVGGRGTRGAIYRVRWTGAAAPQPKPLDPALAACVQAPQPYSSWSRAKWIPAAEAVGRDALIALAADESVDDDPRVRAIEIVTELFGGLQTSEVARFAESNSSWVRARAAWSYGRMTAIKTDSQPLGPYLKDADPHVKRAALEALLSIGPIGDEWMLAGLAALLGDDDKFVRQTASRVVGRMTPKAYSSLSKLTPNHGARAVVAQVMGAAMRSREFNAGILEIGVKVVEDNHPLPVRRDAARLVQMALGGLGPLSGPLKHSVFDGYSTPVDLSPHESVLEPVRARLAACFPAGDLELDEELLRSLAMMSPADGELLDRVLSQISDASDPVAEIHHLVVAARIPVDRTPEQAALIARGLAGLQAKLDARELKQDANWDDRVSEMYLAHVKLDPGLPELLFAQESFGDPGHVVFLKDTPQDQFDAGAAAFARRIDADPEYRWSADVVFLLGKSGNPEYLQMLRSKLDDPQLLPAILVMLSKHPEESDRPHYVAGLESPYDEAFEASVAALTALPASEEVNEQFALLRALRRLGSEEREQKLRDKVVSLLERNTGEEFDTASTPAEAVAQWSEWLTEEHPQEAATLAQPSTVGLAELQERLTGVEWEAGDSERGAAIFEARSCSRCHNGRQALGPDLAGATRRFSRDDLFIAIGLPDRDVSPRYQTTLVETTDGKSVTGLVVYESVDGILLRSGTNQTFRVEADEIEGRRALSTSIMPSGLLNDVTPQQMADLYAYLETLAAPSVPPPIPSGE